MIPEHFTGISREIDDIDFCYGAWLLGTKRYWIHGREVSRVDFEREFEPRVEVNVFGTTSKVYRPDGHS